MNLWQRAAGTLKDKNSLWITSFTTKSPYRNPDLEAAVIKATSHDQDTVDYKNAQRVFAWIRTSPHNLKPLAWALTMRMDKTRSWIVAVKGLMLMHGVFYCKILAVDRIGRLPFDLSNFSDRHSKNRKNCAYDAFIRAYFAFLDQRSGLLSKDGNLTQSAMEIELIRLQKLQTLLDLLLKVKPQINAMNKLRLILEAMDCIIVEIFDVYSKICKGISKVLAGIYSAGKLEAEMALKIVQKAKTQGEELSQFFEFCKSIGALNPIDCPTVERIPDEDIRDLERIINGVSDEMAIVVKDSGSMVQFSDSVRVLKTIITEKWEIFDEDMKVIQTHECSNDNTNNNNNNKKVKKKEDLPDLITF